MDAKVNKTYPLWKALWFFALPVTVVFLVLWGLVFSYIGKAEWDQQLFSVLLTSKLTAECVLYFGFLYFFMNKTKSNHWAPPIAVCFVLVTMIAIVIKSLLTHLLM